MQERKADQYTEELMATAASNAGCSLPGPIGKSSLVTGPKIPNVPVAASLDDEQCVMCALLEVKIEAAITALCCSRGRDPPHKSVAPCFGHGQCESCAMERARTKAALDALLKY